MKLISVIIAIYNTEKYLSQCLKSIINQTYDQLEIILVDDGSTDHSAEICKNYAKKDSRIKYIYQKNSGVSCARNNGLSKATGDYIYFADSDDFLEPNMLEFLCRAIEENEAQVASCHWRSEFDESKAEIYSTPLEYPKNVECFNSEQAIISLLDFRSFLGFGWNKLFVGDLLRDHHICFDESLAMMEDELLCCQAIKEAQKMVYVPLKLYHYRLSGSSSTRNNSFNLKMLQRVSAIDKIEKVAINFHSKDVMNAFYYRRMIVDIEAKRYLLHHRKFGRVEWRLCRKRIRKHIIGYLKKQDNYGGKRYKIMAISFCIY